MKKNIQRLLIIGWTLLVCFFVILHVSICTLPTAGPYHYCSLIMTPKDECEVFGQYFCVANGRLLCSKNDEELENVDFSYFKSNIITSYVNEIESDGQYLYILRNQEIYCLDENFKLINSIEDYSTNIYFYSMAYDFKNERLFVYLNFKNDDHLMILDKDFKLNDVCTIVARSFYQNIFIDSNKKISIISDNQTYHCDGEKMISTTNHETYCLSISNNSLLINGTNTNQSFPNDKKIIINDTIYVDHGIIRFAIYYYCYNNLCLDTSRCIEHFGESIVYEFDTSSNKLTKIASFPERSFLIGFSDKITYYCSGHVYFGNNIKDIDELQPSGEFYLEFARSFRMSDAGRVTILACSNNKLYIYDKVIGTHD